MGQNSLTVLYIVIYLIFAYSIAWLMETYKKVLRKNKAKTWECRLIAAVLSVAAVVALIALHIFKPIVSYLGASVWVDYIAAPVVMYFLQKNTDQKVVKKLTKAFAVQMLIRAGLDKSQAMDVLEGVRQFETADDHVRLMPAAMQPVKPVVAEPTTGAKS